MQRNPEHAATSWIRPGFARLLAILWVGGLALVYLIRYDAWALPVELAYMIGASAHAFQCGPHFREFWTTRACDFLCVFGIVATALGLGAAATDRLIARRDLLGVLFALAIGFWLLAVLVLVVGAVSVAKVPYVFLVLACWLLPGPRKFVRDYCSSTERTDSWGKLLVACIVVAAVLNLAGALAPPFEYDELEYHLGALADYQRASHILFLPHNFYSNMPQLTEMLYLLAKTATSDIAAKILHWLFGVLGALAVYGVAQRLWSKAVGVTAAALFYCVPFVQDLGQTARIDLATAFFATLAFGALVLWTEDEQKMEFRWLSALCAGAAVATKWPAVSVVVLPLILLFVFRKKTGVLPTFCFMVGIMVVPWLVKNWSLAANPVYPLLYKLFPNPYWNAEQAMVFSDKHAPTFNLQAIGQFFALAWRYSFVEAGATPFLLMTAPLMLLLARPESAAKRLGLLFVGAYASWFCCTFRPWRFLFPAFGVAAIVGAFAVEKLGRDLMVRIILRLSVGIIMAVSLAALALNDLVDVENPKRADPQLSFVRYDLGQFTREEFVARMGRGVLEPIVWMNENLAKDAKVLYVGEARAYYATNPVLWSTAFDQHPLTVMSQKAKTPDELVAALRSQGVTHVYVNFAELDRLRSGYNYMLDADWNLIRHTIESDMREIHKSGRGIVYELIK
jgi:4-amino-4-deoxy-L-arabinose transferase-like glycosyltransferase